MNPIFKNLLSLLCFAGFALLFSTAFTIHQELPRPVKKAVGKIWNTPSVEEARLIDMKAMKTDIFAVKDRGEILGFVCLGNAKGWRVGGCNENTCTI